MKVNAIFDEQGEIAREDREVDRESKETDVPNQDTYGWRQIYFKRRFSKLVIVT